MRTWAALTLAVVGTLMMVFDRRMEKFFNGGHTWVLVYEAVSFLLIMTAIAFGVTS